jgi:PAS domain S-box-containing protein
MDQISRFAALIGRVIPISVAGPALTPNQMNSQNQWFVWIVVALLTAQALVIAYLLFTARRRSRAERALKQRVNQLALLNEIGSQIAIVFDLETLFKQTVELVYENFGYYHVAIFTLNWREKTLQMRAIAGADTSLWPVDYTMPFNLGMIGWVVEHNQTRLANDVSRELYYQAYFDQSQTQAELSVPIHIRGGVIGVLDIQSPTLHAFDQNDVLVMKTLADQIAVAIENVQLYNALKQELTEREQAETQLRLSEERYRQSVENSPNPIFSVDRSGFIQTWNQACEDIFEVGAEIIGQKYRQLLRYPQDAKRIEIALSQVFLGHSLSNLNLTFKSQTGVERFMAIRLYPLFDNQGDVQVAIFANTDITEQVLAEQEIRLLNEALEQRVKERTAQLEAANKEVEAFAYSVSHDLRAPLRSVDGFSQALLEDYADQLDSTAQDYLRRVRAASQRMGQLIDDLLKLSRVTRGELSHTQVDLSALAQEIAAELQLTQPKRQVEFNITPGLSAYGDGRLLRLVLENLLGNAWKFTRRHAHAQIEFSCMQVDSDTIYFVRDDGAGFDMTYADKLFGAFQRLHASTDFEGTGIGLATVQRIIYRHGGRLWAEAEVEKGATFYFTL